MITSLPPIRSYKSFGWFILTLSPCELPGHTFVLLLCYTKVLLCSSNLFISPFTPHLSREKGPPILYLAVASCQQSPSSCYPISPQGPVVLVGLYSWVVQSLCGRFGAEVQRYRGSVAQLLVGGLELARSTAEPVLSATYADPLSWPTVSCL